MGWVWSPSGSFGGGGGGVGRWRPVTGVWVRSTGGVGIVPPHPNDVKGKTPLNLQSGLFAVTTRGVSGRLPVENGERWKVENKPARDVLQNQLAAASAPSRVSRTMAGSGVTGSRAATGERDSTIIFDRTERRFVNSDATQSTARGASESSESKAGATAQGSGQVQGQGRARIPPGQNRSAGDTTANVPPTSDRANGREAQSPSVPNARPAAPAPPRPAVAPPSVPRAVTTERIFNEGRANSGGGSRGGAGGAGSPSPRASAPAPSASSGSSARSSSGSSSGGGRPH